MASSSIDLPGLLAIAAGMGWASGIRLYATLFVVGLAGRLAWVGLPEGLRVLEHPWVLGASGVMLLVEFLVDKVPWVDTLWDGVQSFVRLPAGAALAAMAFGGYGVEWQTAAAIVGGGLAAAAHAAKAGTRAALNLSPEPFSNLATSLAEDSLALGGLWLMFAHPWWFLGCLVVFLALLYLSLVRCLRLRRERRQART